MSLSRTGFCHWKVYVAGTICSLCKHRYPSNCSQFISFPPRGFKLGFTRFVGKSSKKRTKLCKRLYNYIPMSTTHSKSSGVRLAEVLASLSMATDLGIAQPMEFALSACILAVRLAKQCGYSEEALREVYYQALLRYIGCNAETDWLSSIAGDEQILRADFHQIDSGDINTVIAMFVEAIRKSFAGESPETIENAVQRGMEGFPHIPAMFIGHCEVAQRLAERLGFDQHIIYGLGQLYERWDG